MDDFEIKEQHESYGLMGLYRQTSSHPHPLFGSSIKHRDTIVMRLNKAKYERGLSHDWYFADGTIVEVEMSQSQFAEIITSLNQGEGFPVTIKYLNGKFMSECPYEDKSEVHLQEFKDTNDKSINDIKTLIKEVEDLFTNKKNLTKADKEHCLNTLRKIQNDVGANAEYRLSAFHEQMDKTTNEAKGEIEAFFDRKIATIAQNALVENQDAIKNLTNTDNPVNI